MKTPSCQNQTKDTNRCKYNFPQGKSLSHLSTLFLCPTHHISLWTQKLSILDVQITLTKLALTCLFPLQLFLLSVRTLGSTGGCRGPWKLRKKECHSSKAILAHDQEKERKLKAEYATRERQFDYQNENFPGMKMSVRLVSEYLKHIRKTVQNFSREMRNDSRFLSISE